MIAELSFFFFRACLLWPFLFGVVACVLYWPVLACFSWPAVACFSGLLWPSCPFLLHGCNHEILVNHENVKTIVPHPDEHHFIPLANIWVNFILRSVLVVLDYWLCTVLCTVENGILIDLGVVTCQK